jgi:hypothetical protein
MERMRTEGGYWRRVFLTAPSVASSIPVAGRTVLRLGDSNSCMATTFVKIKIFFFFDSSEQLQQVRLIELDAK